MSGSASRPSSSRQSPTVAIVVTHIAPARGYGGIAECTARVAQAWGEAGHEVILCASDASEGAPLRPDELGLPGRVSPILYRARGWPRWGFGLGALPAIWTACHRADLVYVSGVATWPTSIAGIVCRLLRRPFTVGVHGSLMAGHVAYIRARKPLKWLFYQLITLPTLRRARAVHATSAIEAEGVRALLPSVPVAIVPNAVDSRVWLPRPPRWPDGGLVIGYVGRLSPEKGILPFLEIWLATRRPEDRLLIAGTGDGDYAAQVSALADGAGGAVECLGYLPADGVAAMLARCDFAVLPSGLGSGGLRENFGNVVVEAMALARPVLVTRGMAWDGVEADGTGLVFDPGPAAAAAVLDRARSLTAEARAAMGQAARDFVEHRFSIPSVGTALWAVVTGDPVTGDPVTGGRATAPSPERG
ncbi:glycosyltransferase [Azospirillum sp. Sh1]|uniref:glycosyltransferase n=1 Tax=Azospirillum sp. Sh1 TaxID=2607285 RepID=UPI0011EC0A81|nr:glycosyltransferase [Azospirillum sp. Sh1]KAA0579297.1 glycosyltransferase [Azospirillum sp. Sh1]